jgi:hypothetical protein
MLMGADVLFTICGVAQCNCEEYRPFGEERGILVLVPWEFKY